MLCYCFVSVRGLKNTLQVHFIVSIFQRNLDSGECLGLIPNIKGLLLLVNSKGDVITSFLRVDICCGLNIQRPSHNPQYVSAYFLLRDGAGNKHCQMYNRPIFGFKMVPSAAPSYIAEHNKFSPILLSVQTYQITILGPFRVLFCVREFMALDLQGLTTEPISQPQIPFLPGKYLCSAKNRINAKCRISLIVKLLYESHLQILQH